MLLPGVFMPSISDPADEAQVIGECPELGVKETREAVQHAHAAFKLWNKATPKERSDKLYKLYNLCMQHQSDLAKLITLENGKSFTDAKAEATYGSGFIEWFAGEAVRERGDIVANMGPGVRNVVIKQGVGASLYTLFYLHWLDADLHCTGVCGIVSGGGFPGIQTIFLGI